MGKNALNQKVVRQSQYQMLARIDRIADMRERITASNLLGAIDKVENKLLDLANEMTAIEVARLSKVLDSQYKRLAKVLPDLKSIELVKRSEDIITIDSMNADAVARLRSVISDTLLGKASGGKAQEVSECLLEGGGTIGGGQGGAVQCTTPTPSYSDSNSKFSIDSVVIDVECYEEDGDEGVDE